MDSPSRTSFLGETGKPVVASRNVGCFLRVVVLLHCVVTNRKKRTLSLQAHDVIFQDFVFLCTLGLLSF